MKPGERFPDLDLPDHTGRPRRLSELAGGDPVALFTSRGWWCPKEQRYMRGLCRLQDEFEVAYARIVVLSVDPPEVQSAFRAGLGARFTFLSDAETPLAAAAGAARDHRHRAPPLPARGLHAQPDLRVHRTYNGYWYFGRPTHDELRRDMREITMAVREDWEAPAA